MSVNRAQTASAENLSFEAGTSHAWCVIHIIKWLEVAGCRAISDRNPLLPYPPQGDDSAATRNILSNQLCLLPLGPGQLQAANERTHADKALVFCSEVLRNYCANASAGEYVVTIEDVYKKCRGKPRSYLEHQLQLAAEEKARNGNVWFHHVLTEIAFLKLRKDIDCRDHGIIPVALDGELPDYLPFVGPTDLVLKRECISLYASDLHKTFFKILLQIYPNRRSSIEKFKDCYMTLKNHWASSGGTVARDTFDATVVECILRAHNSILQQAPIATRHRLRDKDIDQVAEQRRLTGDTAEELARKRRFLNTLATVPYRDRKDRNPERDEGTCIWFKDHSKFQDWQESKAASLLWVSADPGCGKSVLAKYLVDNVLPTTGDQFTCYFFFKDDFEDQRTLVSALRCLLHQIFEHNISLLDDELFSRLAANGQILSSRTDLWEILTDIFKSQVVGGFVCIIDAFDECSADDRSFLMKSLKKLFMDEAAPPIRLLLTSRPYEDIARGLRKLQNKELIIHLKGESEQEMDNISQEIDLVIAKNVNDLGEDLDLESDVTDLIKLELTKVGNRTYLWVALMIDILKNAIQTSKSAMQSLIRQLPRSVSAAYEKILSREQNDETNAKTRRLLHIIMAAKTPLTPGEISVAFSMSERTPFHEETISRDTKFIRDFSRLLVVIRDEKTYLAHQTVKEFLIMESSEPPRTALLGPFERWAHSFHPHHSHCVMAESCMSYLERHTSGEDVFLKYAAINWSDHLRESGDVDEVMVVQSRNLCDSSSEQFSTWFNIYWKTLNLRILAEGSMPPTNPTGLIVASMLGLRETVMLVLNTQQDLDEKDNSLHKTAFSWACYGMHVNVAEFLLDWVSKSNANILNRVINTMDRWGATPLHDVLEEMQTSIFGAIVEASSEHILRLLLNSGANTNSQNIVGLTPLHHASFLDEAVVKLLLQSGANPRLRGLDGDTALHFAVRSDDLAVAKLLLENGAECNIDSENFENLTPLVLAVQEGSLDMVKLLLDHEADVNQGRTEYDSSGLLRLRTPLSEAVDIEDLDKAYLLLKRGANIDVASREWEGLLFHAVYEENMEVGMFLLGRGGDPNFIWHDYQTPLLAALEGDDKEMIELLLRHGADVNYPLPEEDFTISSETTTLMQLYRENASYPRPE
ncbi:hypothetical protein G7054_g7010 [Neopestalotiopsis clavispora]|nr:hypothetical protein G7054_g7010 [Neopestalotiopsis clavispora]